MKTIFAFALFALFATPVFAAQTKTLVCKSLDKKPFVQISSISVVLPDYEKQTNLEWINQTVKIAWINPDDKVLNREKVDMKADQIDERMGMLKGSFSLGGDYGDVGVLMFYSYDDNEVIVLTDVATDGPIYKGLTRCKVPSDAQK